MFIDYCMPITDNVVKEFPVTQLLRIFFSFLKQIILSQGGEKDNILPDNFMEKNMNGNQIISLIYSALFSLL